MRCDDQLTWRLLAAWELHCSRALRATFPNLLGPNPHRQVMAAPLLAIANLVEAGVSATPLADLADSLLQGVCISAHVSHLVQNEDLTGELFTSCAEDVADGRGDTFMT